MGINEKIFKTKYLIFEYRSSNEGFVITKFWMTDIWKLVNYNRKYPLSIQVKRNIWYNIRPCSKNTWDDPEKTANKFIECLTECIQMCPHLLDKENIIESITNNWSRRIINAQ